MLAEVEALRLAVSKATDPRSKSQLAQFLTPARIARFMAGLFERDQNENCRLLDAGAGIGSLSAAFLDRWLSGGLRFKNIEVNAFEIDESLCSILIQTLERYGEHSEVVPNIRCADFVHVAVERLSGNLFSEAFPRYTHAILNPPYKKISSKSAYRLALRRVGIETVNLYSAFVALAVALAEPGGQIVAIIPRSFCNGPYYRPFRDFILERSAICYMHLFKSRSKAFKDDKVLQENIIIRLVRSGRQGPVTVSTSTDDTFNDLDTHDHPFERILRPENPERFIHVPASPERNAIDLSPSIRYTLADLDIEVSTGPVIDFRLKDHLRDMPGPGTVPLLYPAHFNEGGITWPIEGMKKPNAIVRNADTQKWLYPSAFYCVVRRFSSKEEKHRIVARLVAPAVFTDAPMLGFENHLNVFHENRRGLPQMLARGLAVYLNTTAVDEDFRRFNGHTQVNATDLRMMKYPSREKLMELGMWAMRQRQLTQTMIDDKFGELLA